MTTKEKNLKKGAKAFDLLQQIQKYANACFEQGTPEYEAVMPVSYTHLTLPTKLEV